MLLKGISVHGVLLDVLLNDGDNLEWKSVHELVQNGIDKGIVRPLPTTVFQKNELEDAFRYMTHRKHIGKVLIKVGSTRYF